MGIGFVFIIYLVGLAVLTLPAMLVCAGFGYFLVRKKSRRVKRAFILGGILLPIIGGIYIIGCIVIMAILGIATGHDVGFGDGFDLPLHNHYHWSAIDDTTYAMIYDLRDTQAVDGDNIHIDSDDRDAFDNVLELQEEGDWLAGAYSTDGRNNSSSGQHIPDRWFLFNTRTHQRFDANSEVELRNLAATQGIRLNLLSSDQFYSNHHLTWVSGMVALILLCLPLLVCFFLWKLTRKFLDNDVEQAAKVSSAPL